MFSKLNKTLNVQILLILLIFKVYTYYLIIYLLFCFIKMIIFPLRTSLVKNKLYGVCKTANNFIGYKPRGLWYSYRDEWYSYCHNTPHLRYKLFEYRYLYSIETISYNIKKIRNIEHFDDFTDEFGIKFDNEVRIDWENVSKNYDGIEIFPYIEKRTVDIPFKGNILKSWYNDWHVSSGCIWNPTGCKSYDRIYLK